jgi:AcrR family transcriptional regulator
MKKRARPKREQIIQAAFEVICSRGYYETRIDDIARRARVAKGTVYLYFPDKPAIYFGIIRWLISQAVGVVSETDRQSVAPAVKLTRIYRTWIEKLQSYPGTVDLLFPEINRDRCNLGRQFREQLLPELHRLLDSVARIVRQGIIARQFRPVDTRLAALNFLNAFRSGLLVNSGHLKIKALPEQALELFLYGVAYKPKGGK